MIVIDIEASALWHGYPVEVGWASTDGRIGAHLIRPTDEWIKDLIWHPTSGKVHRIHSSTAMELGERVEVVSTALNTGIGGGHVWSDHPPKDSEWLSHLYAATSGIVPGFELQKDDIDGPLLALFDQNKIPADLAIYISEKQEQSHTHTAAGDAAAWVAALQCAMINPAYLDRQVVDIAFTSWAQKAAQVSARWRPIPE